MPVNHHLQPLYRILAAGCGLYVLVFGIVALVRTASQPVFAQHDLPSALGLHANRGFAILSLAAGAILIGGALIGRNVDHWINLVGGIVFLTAGLTMMTLMQTSLDFLGFTMSTCIVSFLIGTVLFASGLYGKIGTATDVRREEQFRHGSRPDPVERATPR